MNQKRMIKERDRRRRWISGLAIAMGILAVVLLLGWAGADAVDSDEQTEGGGTSQRPQGDEVISCENFSSFSVDKDHNVNWSFFSL